MYLDIDEYNNTNNIGTNSSFRNKSFSFLKRWRKKEKIKIVDLMN